MNQNIKKAVSLAEHTLEAIKRTKVYKEGMELLLITSVQSWVEPTKALDTTMEAQSVRMRDGDNRATFLAYNAYSWIYCNIGLPLEPLLKDIEKFNGQMYEKVQ
jgi:hypothetical protein